LEENNLKFLDIGCGDGNLTVEFAAKTGAGERYGIDSHEPATDRDEKAQATIVQTTVVSEAQIEQGKTNGQ
jgi:precorrin-6B methylase 2